jgi:hypothetical protein
MGSVVELLRNVAAETLHIVPVALRNSVEAVQIAVVEGTGKMAGEEIGEVIVVSGIEVFQSAVGWGIGNSGDTGKVIDESAAADEANV